MSRQRQRTCRLQHPGVPTRRRVWATEPCETFVLRMSVVAGHFWGSVEELPAESPATNTATRRLRLRSAGLRDKPRCKQERSSIIRQVSPLFLTLGVTISQRNIRKPSAPIDCARRQTGT